MTTAYDWSGAIGDVWAAEWARTDRSFAALSRHLDAAIAAAALPGPFRALDIGCGAGGTSLALAAARPDATIVGIDLSEGLIAVARERLTQTPTVLPRRREPRATQATARNPGPPPARGNTEEGGGVTFHPANVLAEAPAHAPYDLLYSRHGVMFFDDPVAAFASLHATAVPGARLIFSCFRAMAENPWAVELVEAAGGTIAPPPAEPLPGPFAFASMERVATILEAAGWSLDGAAAVDFAYRAGEGEDPVADALGFFRRIGPAAPLIRAADPADRPAILARITALLEARRTGTTIDFPAAAWIWSATAQKDAQP